MALRDKKTNLHTGADLDAERDDLIGRTEWPPATVAERLADRATWNPPYGSAQIPPAPQWQQGVEGPVSGGWQSDRQMLITWISGVGAKDGSGAYSGTDGLDLAGITGHYLYVAVGAAPLPTTPAKTIGASTNALLDQLAPDTTYSVAIAAFNASGTGPKSEILTVRTQPAAA
ncbi:fibronectin type III domain-containing protein [Streptomyces sp. NPDC001674]|uniref:fibronectin type III domain-containing protein n=1 Tax=Streptomyces sp. NPDC001674 TaxID=3154394 RepID=UPI00331BAC2D